MTFTLLRRIAWCAALLLFGTADAQAAQSHWRIIDLGVDGPYIDAVLGGDGSVWVSSSKFEGFIKVPSSGPPQLLRTPGFTPSYLTYGQDGRVWATDTQRPRAIGAATIDGQLTVYMLQPGLDRIPASKIQSFTNFGFTHVAAAAHLLRGWRGFFVGSAYPSGLTNNHDIAIARQNLAYVYVTECCLAGGGAIAAYNMNNGNFSEFALPYEECTAPAGLAYASGYLYVVCAGKSDTLLVIVNASTGSATPKHFPGHYTARVNTVMAPGDGKIYFAPGSGPRIVEYNPVRDKFSTIKTPDGSIPRAIGTGPGPFVILARGRKRLYEFSPD